MGSVVAAQLTKAGVKNLSIIDSDTLETHNIIRHLCDIRDLGRCKTDAVKDKLLGINNDMEVECFQNDFIKDYYCRSERAYIISIYHKRA